jgi:GxxExxY protein
MNKEMKATENTESTEKDQLSHAVIGAALEVHRLLGPGLLESIYEEALCHELRLRGLGFERQKAVDVVYKDVVIKGQRLDLMSSAFLSLRSNA